MDSMAGQIGLSIVHRSVPRRLADAPQLQVLLEDLTDPLATISEGDGNNEEDIAAKRLWYLDRVLSLPPMSVDGGTQDKSLVLHLASWN